MVLHRRTFRPGVTALVSLRMGADGFLVAFTERTGGFSRGPYQSLNLGFHSGDAPDRVLRNRKRVCRALGLPDFTSTRQVHGSRVLRVGPTRARAGVAGSGEPMPVADALVTTRQGVPLAVMVADCVPVALADPSARKVGVIHAGWRGIAEGVLLAALEQFDDPGRLRAAIGPAIGWDHYEVGEDVARAVSAASTRGAIVRREGSRLRLDLSRTVARVLKEHGVRSIERAAECTACERTRFFSYRRDGVTGRQALIAARLA